jgi:hypothetical protein
MGDGLGERIRRCACLSGEVSWEDWLFIEGLGWRLWVIWKIICVRLVDGVGAMGSGS